MVFAPYIRCLLADYVWHIIIKAVNYSKSFFLLELFFFSRFWWGFIFVRFTNLRAIGVSTNSTQEVGEVYLKALRDAIPNFRPHSYLGDAAEAFANAAKVVFDSITFQFF